MEGECDVRAAPGLGIGNGNGNWEGVRSRGRMKGRGEKRRDETRGKRVASASGVQWPLGSDESGGWRMG